MPTIGTFTRDAKLDIFSGRLRTLTLDIEVEFVPRAGRSDNDKAPNYYIWSNGLQIGAAWTKASRDTGAEYLSAKLDDPMFPAPIYVSLTQGDGGEWRMIWAR